MVGNGVTDWTFDTVPAFVAMGSQFDLYSTATRNQLAEAKCTFIDE
jgi:hypothetical protein